MNYILLIKILLLLTYSLLSACGPPRLNATTLGKPTIRTSVTLKEVYAVSVPAVGIISSLKVNAIYSLSVGPYIAELESSDGVYYRGTQNCVTIVTETLRENKPPLVTKIFADGGLYIPADRSERAKLYVIIDQSEAQITQNFITRGLNTQKGDIFVPTPQPSEEKLAPRLETENELKGPGSI